MLLPFDKYTQFIISCSFISQKVHYNRLTVTETVTEMNFLSLCGGWRVEVYVYINKYILFLIPQIYLQLSVPQSRTVVEIFSCLSYFLYVIFIYFSIPFLHCAQLLIFHARATLMN